MVIENDVRWNYLGLSTDPKPTVDDNLVDGTTFYEVDTSKLYFWTRGRWYEKTSNVLTNIEKEMKW